MATSRRDFLLTAAAGGALGLGFRRSPLVYAPQHRNEKLNILILGGTSFIGPYVVRNALEHGHTVALFNRGKTNPGLFPKVETLIGDRNNDLKSLEGRKWDIVIDISATDPNWVELSAKLLQNAVKRYLFISTRSVYFDTSRVPMTIDAQLCTRENTPVEAGKPLPYCLAKSISEGVVKKYFGDRTLIVRPSIVVGPGDLTDRFTYWPVRIERGGEVLAPGDGTDSVQFIDVRDLGEWTVRLVEQGTVGIYNALGPRTPRSFAELLHGIKAATTSECTFTWVDTDFLLQNQVRPYQEMPVWQPARNGKEGFARFDVSREVALGLTFRPLAVTTRDTLDFYHSQPSERQEKLRAGITAEREAEVLARWKARKAG